MGGIRRYLHRHRWYVLLVTVVVVTGLIIWAMYNQPTVNMDDFKIEPFF